MISFCLMYLANLDPYWADTEHWAFGSSLVSSCLYFWLGDSQLQIWVRWRILTFFMNWPEPRFTLAGHSLHACSYVKSGGEDGMRDLHFFKDGFLRFESCWGTFQSWLSRLSDGVLSVTLVKTVYSGGEWLAISCALLPCCLVLDQGGDVIKLCLALQVIRPRPFGFSFL